MNEEELKSKLESIGKTVFVECFYIFQRYAAGTISRGECIDEMMAKDPDKEESGCNFCCGNAKLIFEADMARNVIRTIYNNRAKSKLSRDTIEKAMAILKKCPE